MPSVATPLYAIIIDILDLHEPGGSLSVLGSSDEQASNTQSLQEVAYHLWLCAAPQDCVADNFGRSISLPDCPEPTLDHRVQVWRDEEQATRDRFSSLGQMRSPDCNNGDGDHSSNHLLPVAHSQSSDMNFEIDGLPFETQGKVSNAATMVGWLIVSVECMNLECGMCRIIVTSCRH